VATGLLIFLLQLAVILVVTRAGAYVAVRLRLAPVIGELAAGLALGPTLFGWLWPAGQAFLFPPTPGGGVGLLSSFAWVGLVLLMFVGGLEVDLGDVRRNLGRALLVAVGALVLAFGAGFVLAGFLPADLFPSLDRFAFRLFVANALAITAIPVLMKVLMDLELLTTRFGTVAVVAGVVVDAAGWVILGVVTRGTTAGFSLGATLTTCALIAAFLAVTFTLGRFVFSRLVKLQPTEDALSINFLASVLALMLLGAAATEYLHIHPVLGAFAVGLMVGMWRLSHRIKEKLADFAFSFFVPVFLATLGLNANLRLINSWGLAGITVAFVVVVSGAKFIGGGGGAKLGGMSWLESLAVGAAANTKGAMGLVAAKVGYDLGVIPGNLYAILVVVSLLLTLIPVFGLQRLRRRLRAADAGGAGA
jgi:Kef-type K+ transport system membrane component KefB